MYETAGGVVTTTGLRETRFSFPGQTRHWKGKVRDLYVIDDRWLVMIATDRISAFDVVLPVTIPYKGQVLNQLSVFFLQQVQQEIPVWLIGSPHPNVSVGILCQPIPVEMILRAYIAGSMWRAYRKGKREWCGERLPDGLRENQKLPRVLLTPTTKAESGHDEDICPDEIIQRGLADASTFQVMKDFAFRLFELGTTWAEQRELILVDTKYEFGLYDGKVYVIDEVHTPDSSRYFYRRDYEERMQAGESPRQLSKEFVRQWLLQQGFSGQEGQTLPPIPEEVVEETSRRYLDLYQQMTGQKLDPVPYHPEMLEEIYTKTVEFLRQIR